MTYKELIKHHTQLIKDQLKYSQLTDKEFRNYLYSAYLIGEKDANKKARGEEPRGFRSWYDDNFNY